MGRPTGFLEAGRRPPASRPVAVRLRDWREVAEPWPEADAAVQAGRCMDCGIPFCTQGCPLGNPIPAFNDAVSRGRWDEAAARLAATNNFPEFTGRLCPAPCESACVLGIADSPVTIERLEYEVAEHAFARGLVVAAPGAPTGRRVAVVGSGPAGLAAAAQLRAAGHGVAVYERADAVGGLLRYGIPEFKLEKAVLDRRLAAMRDAGVAFHPSTPVGDAGVALDELREAHDAVVLCVGATRPRLVEAPGSGLAGVVVAMDYLTAANRAVRDAAPPAIDAGGRHVVILGGGDTGADCLGTVHRQGAASVTQVEILDRPPDERPADQPWPTMARLFKTTSAHEEGGERLFSTETLAFEGVGRVERLRVVDRATGQTATLAADLVLVAAGFLGPEASALGLGPDALEARGTIAVDDSWRVAALGDERPVYACGDAVRGQSLVVWAIAEGRSAAAALDARLSGATRLASPLAPHQASW